jgi:hypothetical protein
MTRSLLSAAPERPAAPAPARLQVTAPAPRAAWREVLAADPEALVTQSPEWMVALRTQGYEDASRLYEMPWGTRLVLPLVRRRGRLASLPNAWGMGGLLADAPLTARDVAAVVDDLAAQRALSVAIRPNPLHAEAWERGAGGRAIALPRCAHVLDLEGSPEHVWTARVGKKTRNMIRKAERSGLDVEFDTTGRLVGVFYELFERSVERWARQQHEPLALARARAHRRDPRRKLERWAAALGPAMRVWVA